MNAVNYSTINPVLVYLMQLFLWKCYILVRSQSCAALIEGHQQDGLGINSSLLSDGTKVQQTADTATLANTGRSLTV